MPAPSTMVESSVRHRRVLLTRLPETVEKAS